MKISYAITVCNELEEIQRLIPFLKEIKRQEDKRMNETERNRFIDQTDGITY